MRDIAPEELTAPERAAERALAKRVREQVRAHGGCACCIHRDPDSEGWGRALCGLAPPALFTGAACIFEPDFDAIHTLVGPTP